MRSVVNQIQKTHQFLSSQLIYPLILSTLLAGFLFVARVLVSRSLAYKNLPWNLFLAWLPYVFSLWAALLNLRNQGRWWLLLIPGGLWLIFFPNAPYIVTDFLHLETRPYIPLWYDITMLATFAWTGCFLAIASLRTMQILVRNYAGWIVSWLFAASVLGLGGLGIYLGRFSRWNSWDLLLNPRGVAKDIILRLIDPLSNLRFFGFTLIFTAFLLVCYLTFISVRRISDHDRLRYE
jgi:uncharacterized membrane protein